MASDPTFRALALTLYEHHKALLALDGRIDDHPRVNHTYTWESGHDGRGQSWTRYERELTDPEVAIVRSYMAELALADDLPRLVAEYAARPSQDVTR